MNNLEQIDRIEANFLDYLRNTKLSAKTFKNYKSDINHFTAWLILKLRSLGISADRLSETIPFITKKTASEYKLYLSQNGISTNTVNRRLSTLRHLAYFLTEIQILDFDFVQDVVNIPSSKKQDVSPIVISFQKHLQEEKVSKNTIKNYVSDIKQFLAWIEANNKTHQTN